MVITLRLFSRLREQLGISDITIELPQDSATIQEVWQHLLATTGHTAEKVSGPILAARNQEHCTMETLISDGDEIAFFPPVTGG